MKLNLVKEICDACWLNQLELADYAGIKVQRIKDISAGRVEGFKSDDIAVLVEKLHLNPNWLLTGDGEIFKEGFSRSFPDKSTFVAELIDRLVKMAEVNFIAPVSDDELDLPKGTVASWIKQGKIPFTYIKKLSEKFEITIDHVLYGGLGFFTQMGRDLKRRQEVFQVLTLADSYKDREMNLLGAFSQLTEEEKSAIEVMVNALAKANSK